MWSNEEKEKHAAEEELKLSTIKTEVEAWKRNNKAGHNKKAETIEKIESSKRCCNRK